MYVKPAQLVNPVADLVRILKARIQVLKNRERTSAWSREHRVLLNTRAKMKRLRDGDAVRAREQASRDRNRDRIRRHRRAWRKMKAITDPEFAEKLRRQSTEASRKLRATDPERAAAYKRRAYVLHREHIIRLQVVRTRRWRAKQKAQKRLWERLNREEAARVQDAQDDAKERLVRAQENALGDQEQAARRDALKAIQEEAFQALLAS